MQLPGGRMTAWAGNLLAKVVRSGEGRQLTLTLLEGGKSRKV